MPLLSLTVCFTGRQQKIFKQSWMGKQNYGNWPHNVPRDLRATKHITDSMLLLRIEHTGRLNYKPHVKCTYSSRIVFECIPLPAMTRLEKNRNTCFPTAAAEENDVMILSTWREEYLLSIISFTFTLPFNLKNACCLGQISFNVFQPEVDCRVWQPQHLNFGRERRLYLQSLSSHIPSPLSRRTWRDTQKRWPKTCFC